MSLLIDWRRSGSASGIGGATAGSPATIVVENPNDDPVNVTITHCRCSALP
ncbi:hypothetical protein [Nannocystis pusilla]|uniref:hypothetical protein n=1 Tax=Nannocystis pusilla TaxID=889268 RepID=UPI003B819D11